MAVHIIDPSKPLPPTYENSQHALRLKDGDVALIMSGAEVAAYGWWAHGIFAGSGSSVTVDGRVHSEFSSGVWMQGGNITVGSTGLIQGEDGAIWFRGFEGQTNVLTNAGQLTGPADGFAAVVVEGGTNIINNSGLIGGGFGGIQTNAFAFLEHEERIIINNTGVIKGSEWAINGSYYGKHIITNKGLIDGMIILGYGDDFYDGRGGTVTGEIFLDLGNDTAYGGDGSETFIPSTGDDFIDGGDGIDTLMLSWYDLGSMVNYRVDLKNTEKQVVGTNSSIVLRNVENLVGGDARDVFIGNDAANTLIGNGGNDTLDGYNGNDLLSGGAGDDLLVGSAGSDTAVFTGKFSDYVITVIAGVGITISDKRASGDGKDYLGGVEFALFSDRIYTLPPVPPVGPVAPSTPAETPVTPTTTSTPPETPVAKNLTFKGGHKADMFVGGKGHDLLNGGLGNDKLTGDEGQDTFVFNSKLGPKNVDRILDFQHSDDTIKLSKAVFSKIEKGMLSKSAFWIGTKAHDKSDRIIFNDKTGALYYDADGSGTKYGAIKFAQLNAKTLLKYNDFFIA